MNKQDIDFINSISNIGTSKFTTETYKENVDFKKKNDRESFIMLTRMTHIPSVIKPNAGIFILEMNNEKNEIEGIGIIKNIPRRCEEWGVRIYNDDYYNSFLYVGKYHITRKNILSDTNNIKPLKLLENLVFKGSHHLKRGWNTGCFSLKNERIERNPCYSEFIVDKHEWKWKNKKKTIRRCSICHRIKDEKHRKLNKNNKTCKLKPIFAFKARRCDSCGQVKHGHICPNIKKQPQNIEFVYNFLRNLFIR